MNSTVVLGSVTTGVSSLMRVTVMVTVDKVLVTSSVTINTTVRLSSKVSSSTLSNLTDLNLTSRSKICCYVYTHMNIKILLITITRING